MTFTYALIGDGGIVLAADSQMTMMHYVDGKVVSAYRGHGSKIRYLKNGSAFSIAGNAGIVESLLAKSKTSIDDSRPFEEVVIEHARLFRKEHERLDRPQSSCAFMFCGYSDGSPQIIKLASENNFDWNPLATHEGYGFTGREQHGAALYLHWRIYESPQRKAIAMESAKCLAYCIVAEVADMDNTVDAPIEMAIITKSDVQPFVDFERYEQKRQHIVATVRSLVHSPV